ncbi:MAG: type II secretion system F family protein [Patescibacteria group bacterium]
MKFDYVATTEDGHIEKGSVQAASKGAVLDGLRQRGLIIMSVTGEGQGRQPKPAANAVVRSLRFGRVSQLDKIMFVRNLGTMLKSGLPLVETLSVVRDQADSKKLKLVTDSVLKDVSNGKTLAASLEQHGNVFSKTVVGMVHAGEASGTLERNLDYIADELERDYELRRKVVSAMIYPAIILSGTLALGIGLSIFILPKLVKMFDTFRVELPGLTQTFLDVATFLVDYGLYVIVGFVAFIIGLRFIARVRHVRSLLHKLVLKLPFIGKLVRDLNLARLTRMLSVLLKSGIIITESIEITEGAVGNIHFKRELGRALSGISKGGSLASSLDNEDIFTPMVRRLVGVGETTGKLEESLAYLADFYEEEVNTITKNLSSVIEPVLLVIIGVVLGFLAVAIISPIYQFTGALSR